MAIQKFYQWKGLNTRLNDLLDQGSASEVKNVQLTKKGSLTKRDGYTQQASSFGTNGLFVNYEHDKLLALERELRTLSGGSWVVIPKMATNPMDATTQPISAVQEVNGTTYITNKDNVLFKYDGQSFYKAGLPLGPYPPTSTPLVIPLGTGTLQTGDFTYYLEYFYQDNNGAIISSGYLSKSISLTAQPIRIQPPNILTAQGYHNHHFIVNGNQFPSLGATATINVDAGHTMEVGDRFSTPFAGVADPNAGEYLYAEILSTTATTITFTYDYVPVPYSFIDNDVFSLIIKRVYKQNDGGLFFVRDFVNDPTDTSPYSTYDEVVSPATGAQGYTIPYTLPVPIREEQFVNYKDITYFQNLLFGIDDENLYWSLTDGIENWSSSNNQLFNDAKEGVCTAVENVNDYLIIFKERAVYFGTGTFGVNQNLKFWRTNTNDIGCSTHASIQIINGEMVFLGTLGIWSLLPGQEPTELGSMINNLITEDSTGLDLSKAESEHDIKNKRYMLFIPATLAANNLVLVYNYFYKQWWVYRGVDFSNGASFFSDELYFIDSSSNTQKFVVGQRNDNSSAIEAFIKTSWESLGDEGIESKYLNLRFFMLEDAVYALSVQSEKNFIEGTSYVDDTKDIDTSSSRTEKLNLGDNKALTTRFIFENNVVDEDLLITGYELEYEVVGRKMKK